MTPGPRHARIPSLVIFFFSICHRYALGRYLSIAAVRSSCCGRPLLKPGHCLCHCRRISSGVSAATIRTPLALFPCQRTRQRNFVIRRIHRSRKLPSRRAPVAPSHFHNWFPKHSRWNATKLQLPAAARGRNQQAFHSCAGDSQDLGSRVAARILHRDVAWRRYSSQTSLSGGLCSTRSPAASPFYARGAAFPPPASRTVPLAALSR